MKKRTAARSMAAVVGAAMVLTACGGGNNAAATTAAAGGSETQATAESSGGGNITKTDIVFAQASDVVTLDPAGQQDTTSSVLMKHVYSTLMDIDDDGNLVPDLAESYEMKSDTEYTFTLRQDACFSDGTPVTAKDVKFTFDRAKDMPKTKSNTSKIEEVIADDDHHVTFKLTQPYAAFKTIITNSNLSIVSEAAVTAAGESYGDVDNILGSGEFTVTEWVPNDHYTLARNEKYWGEMPITTTITCRVIPEGSARAIALEAGEVDLVWNVDATDCANIEANPDVTLLSQTSSSIEYLGMNTTKEKFKDVRVRQAINYALDKQTFVDTIIEGRGTVANSYINSMIPGWTDEVEAYPYDPAKAKELLAEAGYPNGFECKIYVNGDVRTRSAQIIQAQLAEVGITVDISTYEWGALLDSLNAGEHEMFLLGWSNSSFDADGSTYQLFYSGNHGATGNRAFLTDDKVDELIINAQKESDDTKRMELYKELQVYLHEISPWCPLYYKNDNVGVRADLKGFKLHKGATHYLFNDTQPCEDADCRKRPHGMPGGVRTHSLKIIQKILEMHGMFGYNVTIMYSTMYSEL